jgi:hypothetical protein
LSSKLPIFTDFKLNTLLFAVEPSANLYVSVPIKSDSLIVPARERTKNTSGLKETSDAPNPK